MHRSHVPAGHQCVAALLPFLSNPLKKNINYVKNKKRMCTLQQIERFNYIVQTPSVASFSQKVILVD